MGLRCSLIGHDFGEPEIEKEREERGSEVVVTVREYEACTRCGKRRVVSESTEVKSLSAGLDADRSPETPVEPAVEDASGASDGEILEDSTDPVDAAGEPGAETAAIGNDTEILDDDSEVIDGDTQTVADDVMEPTPTTSAESQPPEVPVDETGEPITDDAEILEETDTPRTDRGHGEWPDASDVGPPTGSGGRPAAWPDSEDDEVTTSTDAEILEFDELEPEPEPEPESESETATDPGTGIASVQSVPAPGQGTCTDDAPVEFFCPRCEFVVPSNHGSLRAGDICPECRKGYLGKRER